MGKDGPGDSNGASTAGGQGPNGGIGNGGKAEYGETLEGFRPDYVKGQMDPKGRIGVTTFRGAPKIGEVTVEIRAGIEAERANAESAIDREAIPRRYREGIRDYFKGLGEKK